MNSTEPRLASRVLMGAVAGFAATLAMGAVTRRLDGRRAARSEADAPALAVATTDRQSDDVTGGDLLHGAASAVLLAVANPQVGLIGGAVAGVSAWTGSKRKPPLRGRLIWGVATAFILREMLAARAAFVAEGEGDGPP